MKGVRRFGVRLGNWLTVEQGRRLLHCNGSLTLRDLRDHAMVALLIGCGLRRGEVLALALESFFGILSGAGDYFTQPLEWPGTGGPGILE